MPESNFDIHQVLDPNRVFDSLIHGALAPFMVSRGELCGDTLRAYDDFDSQPGKNPVAYRLPTYLGRVYWSSAFIGDLSTTQYRFKTFGANGKQLFEKDSRAFPSG